LLIRLSGVRKMRKLPDLLFVVDVSREDAAVHEANLLKIPVVALVDTNCNPQGIDYVIPSNDDAIRAIKLLVARAAEAVLEGKAMRKDQEPEGADEMGGVGTADSAHAYKTAKVVESDEEVEEGALLGESTLAKLSATRKPEDIAASILPVEGTAEGGTSPESPVVAEAATEIPEQSPASAPSGEPGPSNPEAGG
jgi:small subunit ribosomal protein S2